MAVVSIERHPPLRLVELDTGRRNVLTLEAIEQLGDAIAEDPEAPVVVLAGRADGFCAGLDNAVLSASRLEREEILTAMGELLLRAISGSTRIVVACTGHAVAAGAMLLLVADVRIGARGRYTIGFTEPRLGMPLPGLPAVLARERLDRRRLHELTVLGRTVGPDEALAAGFLDALVDPEEVRDTARRRAEEIATLSEAAYRGSLEAVWGPALERIESTVAAQVRRRDAARADAG